MKPPGSWPTAVAATPIGAVTAFWLALLGLFLNSQPAPSPGELAGWLLGASFAGAGLGALAALVAWRVDTRQALRRLPWWLAGSLGLGAAAYAWHASARAFYLSPVTNDRLLAAAGWLATLALVFFYTALLHSLGRRPYGRRSRIGLTLGLVVTLAAVTDRFASQRPRTVVPPGPAPALASANRLLFVSLPGATLDVILPLAERGELPFLADTIARGVVAPLQSLAPARPLPLETTLATGSYPWRHGRRTQAPCLTIGRRALDLLPFGTERWCRGGPGHRPSARHMPALWEILSGLGIATAVLSGPEPAPAAGPPLLAYLDADAFGGADAAPGGHGWPRELATRLASAAEASGSAPFPPDSPATRGWRLDAPRLAAALAILDEERPQALWLALPGFAAVAEETYGGFVAATLAGSRNREAVTATAALVAYCAWLDASLGQLAAAMPAPTLLTIVSASGTARLPLATLRGLLRGRPLEGGRLAGDPNGAWLLAGPGVAAGRRLVGARVVDVLPTLLYAMGLPATRDIDGRMLTAAFSDDRLATTPLAFVETYRALLVAGDSSPAF